MSRRDRNAGGISHLRWLWWQIAGEPELWVWPREVQFLWKRDPPNILRLKVRLESLPSNEAAEYWYRDRETGQVWHRVVGIWEFWEMEIWTPVDSYEDDTAAHTPTGV